MLLLRTLLILGVNAEKLCDRINRAHCLVETMIQGTYSFVEEGIIWGHAWPWWCYVNTPGISLVLKQLVHSARNCLFLIVCVRTWARLELLWFAVYQSVEGTGSWNLYSCVLRKGIVFLQWDSLYSHFSTNKRFELVQSTCYEFKCAEGCSKCCHHVASFSINGRDWPLSSPTRNEDWRDEGFHL